MGESLMEEQQNKAIQELNEVIQSAIRTMEQSKAQIFEIAESAKMEGYNLKRELDMVVEEVKLVIETYDQYERKYKLMRMRLSEVSKNFHLYSEKDIRDAYEETNQILIDLRLTSERERYLRKRRDELSIRLKNLERTIAKAESLMSQIGVVLGYLQGDIARMTLELESAKDGHLFGLRIIEAQEEERKRVAREIHDGPAQSMANVVLRAELADRMMSQGNIEQAKVELRDLKSLVRSSLSDVRRIIYDLRPMALDDLGLVPALRRFIEAYGDSKEFEIDFRIFGLEERLPSSMEVAIYRLVQESINNISKHAKAKHVTVHLEFKPLKILIKIVDDGIGFAEAELKKGSRFGLMGMRERVKLLDGEIQIISAPNQGTKILIEIPLPLEKS
jgi:two-component system sensor histidine kinase DegS